ncbi:MAG TPA: FtsX-like permease family protein [Pirellulales bacterium]|nr:FtsX-like permease family protein [Pirellulales bacterium]
MYILLLCWRYLRTRYIALASVVSVTLGVATMIVVNSVMSGFAFEMRNRLHGILADVIFESHSLDGFPNPEYQMEHIRQAAGDDIEGMTATVHVPAMLSFQYGGKYVTRPVTLIGIDSATQSQASDFGKYLQHPENRREMSFELREGGYDTRDHQAGREAKERNVMELAGWEYRRWRVQRARDLKAISGDLDRVPPPDFDGPPPVQAEGAVQADGAVQAEGAERVATDAAPDEEPSGRNDDGAPNDGQDPSAKRPVDPFAPRAKARDEVFDPLRETYTGLVLGIALSSFHDQEGEERFLVLPGDDVQLAFPNASIPLRIVSDRFTIVDFYESKMSEYDGSFVFVPIRKLQELRGMIDPETGVTFVNSIQIKLKDESKGDLVRDKLRKAFPMELFNVSTWRDKQGPLLAAVQMETAILNILLFLIIAVAGFGILAIFFMIVVEKTRDIGILKALGASGRGIMGIFLAYGLSLGIVGSGAGMVLGLLFVVYINEIAKVLSKMTGHEVFDPSIYYFYKIPTIIDPWTVAWIVCGALAIAVLASVLPARRAARLHPVEALRYE